MEQKAGRNDPCPCGSGKKYKQCCLLKKASAGKRKLTAKWINAPQGPNLMERTFGQSVASAGKAYTPPPADKKETESTKDEQ